MAWFSSDMTIKFDVDGINDRRTKLLTYSHEMKQIRVDLKNAMEQLVAKDWRGNAADKFKAAISDDWCDTVDRYCELMNQLCVIMQNVIKEYESMQADGERLRLEG